MASTRRTWVLTALVVSAAALVGPAIAHATTYCVPDDLIGPACTAGQGKSTIQAALTAAAGGPGGDFVEIAGGSYAAPSPAGLVYSSTNPVHVIGGIGGGTTTITMPDPPSVPASATNYFGLSVSGNGSTVAHLTVTMPTPADVANTHQHFEGIDTQAATETLDHITVTAPAVTSYNGQGIVMDSGALSDSTITMPLIASGIPSIGVWEIHSTTSDLNLTDDAITANYGFQYDNQSSATGYVGRSQITASSFGILAQAARVSVSDTFINLGANSSAHGLEVGYSNLFAHTSSLTADGVSIFGSGGNQVGVHVFGTDDNTLPNPGDPDIAGAAISNSIIRLTGSLPTPIWRAADHNGIVNVTTSYSDYDSSKELDGPNMNGATGAITASNNVFANPLFVNEGTGDLHLQAGSPLIDAGDPATPAGVTDVDGDPRAVMAIASCTPRRDIGADEFVPASAVTPLDCTPPPTGTTPPATTPPVTPGRKKCKRKHRSAAAAKKRCKKKR